MTIEQPQYTEASIRILEGLEPVKLRPGMYTRTTSPLHIVQEILDNSVDEAIGGYAKTIVVELLPGNCVRITDDGRGIPVGLHPEKKIPVVEAVFTVLHSGGKFDKAGGGAYSYAGGLHGVGVSVTNALSDVLEVTVNREGNSYRVVFNNGDVAEPLLKIGPTELRGTSVLVQPNPKYFDTPEIDAVTFRNLVKTKAVLLPGLTTTFVDSRDPDNIDRQVFCYSSGLVAYLEEQTNEPLTPIISAEVYIEKGDDHFAQGEGAAWALGFYESAAPQHSYVNLIPTPQGGTHLAGLRSSLFNAVRGYIEHHNLTPKGIKLTADDVFKNVGAVLSARVLDPSFENQTKDRLNSREVVKLIERVALPYFEGWLNLNPTAAKVIAELSLRNAATRQRQQVKPDKRRSSSVVVLPGKLSDCESTNSAETELFLVEGDSAGGSAKMGRSKYNQAILPLRGKGLNVWEKDAMAALANQEIRDIATAIGIEPHTPETTLDWSKLRYGKINILSDADVDGFHIQVLLLTLFLKHFPQLIERGHIYVSTPPLYRVDAEAVGKSRPEKKIYAMDDKELNAVQKKLEKEGYTKWKVGRFKGLGEMDPPELWDTTLNPDTRRLSVIGPGPASPQQVEEVFDNLMAKKNADWRRAWIERRGHEIANAQT